MCDDCKGFLKLVAEYRQAEKDYKMMPNSLKLREGVLMLRNEVDKAIKNLQSLEKKSALYSQESLL